MEEEDLFDEFGNYIGPEPESREYVANPQESLDGIHGLVDEEEEDVNQRFAMVSMEDGGKPFGISWVFCF